MATQENKEYSGSSSSFPSLMLPKRENAKHAITTMHNTNNTLNSQPKCSSPHVNAAEETFATDSGAITPHTTNATIATAVTPKTALSMPNWWRCSSTAMPGTSPGCISSG